MKHRIIGKNMDVSDGLKKRIAKKLGKLEKFFSPETEAVVTMSILKNWHILELTIVQNSMTFRAEEKSNDMYVSIDSAVDVVERQIRKNKTRLAKRIHENAFNPADAFEDSSFVVEEADYKVARSKKFPLKPMTLDEAILQMNLLSHAFFVFVNADTKRINVVYRRKDGDYGLIEPDV
jgi:putative sigma-54 modulation protein